MFPWRSFRGGGRRAAGTNIGWVATLPAQPPPGLAPGDGPFSRRSLAYHFFFGRFDGEYCSFGSALVRSQPISPSQ